MEGILQMKPQLSVVVPCYNEEKNIPLLVKRWTEVRDPKIESELILVDNGSTDGSAEVLKKMNKKGIRSVNVEKNIGYGFGIWSGLKAAKGDIICWTHADLQTDLKDTLRGYRIINGSKDPKKTYVKGKRYGRPLMDRLFTSGMSIFETVILGKVLYDINAQPNIFHRSFLDRIGEPPKDFSFDLYFYYMAKRKRYNMIRFPVNFSQRIHGKSSWNTGLGQKWKFIKRTISFTMKLKKRLR